MINFISNNFSVFLKGIAMGFADLMPGVSGGTIALILGVYKKLIESIVNGNALKAAKYQKNICSNKGMFLKNSI